jgi:hypothetical protein
LYSSLLDLLSSPDFGDLGRLSFLLVCFSAPRSEATVVSSPVKISFTVAPKSFDLAVEVGFEAEEPFAFGSAGFEAEPFAFGSTGELGAFGSTGELGADEGGSGDGGSTGTENVTETVQLD